MATKCEFIAEHDKTTLTTCTNGDRIEVRGIHLGAEEAGNLAVLINSGVPLCFIIKDGSE